MVTFSLYLCITLFIIVCIFLILVILIQKGRGGGLASAFGGAGGNTAFGSKTGDVLTWVTSIVFGLFLLLAIALNMLADAQNTRVVGQLPSQEPAAQTPATPAAPASPAAPAQSGQLAPVEATTPAAPQGAPTTNPR